MQPVPYSLRFDSTATPALIELFQDAVAKLDVALGTVSKLGWLPEPWLGDPESARVAAHFNQVAVTDELSGLNVFRLYQRELQNIIAQLQATAAGYVAHEESTAKAFGVADEP